MTSLIVIIALLTINAFFVAAEFALVKVRAFRIEKVADEGSASAKMTMRILDNLESYLAACQLGITMASLGLGWVGEPAVAALLEPLFHDMAMPEAWLHPTAFMIGFLLFSSLHIVIGEQVPKSYAIRKADTVSLWVAYPLHLAYLMVFPLTWLLDRASRGILSFFNVEEATHAEIYSDEELQGFVSTSRDEGHINQEKADMLTNIFDFDQRSVGRVMVPRNQLKVLDVSLSVEHNQRTVMASGHSRFPLIDSANSDKILGIVLVKAIYRSMLEDDMKNAWEDLSQYCREPMLVPEQQKIALLFETMRLDRNHIAIVVDEYGTFSGIVTLEDLLEEIVGDIEDETDDESLSVEELSEGRWRVNGLMSLSDAGRAIGLNVDTELNANTISGLLIERLERMPIVGDIVLHDQFRITVRSMAITHVATADIFFESDVDDHNIQYNGCNKPDVL